MKTSRKIVIYRCLRRAILFLLIMPLSVIISCSGRDGADISPDKPAASAPAAGGELATYLTEANNNTLSELRSGGALRVAVTSPIGDDFFGELFIAVMSTLDLSWEPVTTQFSDFFTIDGSIPPSLYDDDEFSYHPDIFQRADILVSDITITPWREQILDFIPIIPTRIVFISRQEDNIEQPEDLNGRTVLLSRATIFEDVVEAMAGEYQLDIRRYYVEPIRLTIIRPFTINTLTCKRNAAVAQSVEQGTENPCVISSILIGGMIFK
jgi:hypothetical protein